jgi:hypothetical protein
MYKFKGAYDAAAVYAVNDVVTFNDLAYRMVVATGAAGVTPCDDTNNWVPLSQDLTQACFMLGGEGGSGGGVTVVHETIDEEEGTATLDMKAGALYAACQQGPVFILENGSCTMLGNFSYDESSGYTFNYGYTAQTADDYPVDSYGEQGNM